ncbi:MAG: redox-regulated ATPase YchF [Alphaproteobacteria bacterium]|nr:redox-regulated ATPase YchF [Alphaproteobacteria bacterium]
MAVSCGLIGLPNVGKSTLFNLLMRQDVAASGNFPFCTIDPQDGQAVVRDERLEKIARYANTKRIVPATFSLTDIAGLIRGASQGEGLGSAFLSNVRNVDALIHVVRFFEDDDIIHVDGSIDPVRDITVIETELVLSDLTFLEKRTQNLQKQRYSKDPAIQKELDFIQKCHDVLIEGNPVRLMSNVRHYHDTDTYKGLLTLKPTMYACNVAADQVADFASSPELKSVRDHVGENAVILPVSVSLEKDLIEVQDESERKELLSEYGIQKEGATDLVRCAYTLLGHISYFTAGEKEVRAWSIAQGDTAVQAAEKIHSDIARGFIVSETVSLANFCEYEGWQGARNAGKVRQEGKDYVMQDGDIVLFRFNV